MQKYYTLGEILLALRTEYNESKYLFEKLNGCVCSLDQNSTQYFFGKLADRRVPSLEDRAVFLCVQRRYNEVLKKIQKLKYDWESQYKYTAYYKTEKSGKGKYVLGYSDVFTPNLLGDKYGPGIEIVRPNEFNELIEEIFATDLMQLHQGYFEFNHEAILLDHDRATINTRYGSDSTIVWDGKTDTIDYYFKRDYCVGMLDEVFNIQIPADEISKDWIKLLEKHKNDYCGFEPSFDNDWKNTKSQGIVRIEDVSEDGTVRLSRLLK